MSYYLPLPHVVESDGRTKRAGTFYSRLLKDRIIFIGTPIDDYVANVSHWGAQMLLLQMEDPKRISRSTSTAPAEASPMVWPFTTRCASSVATSRPTAWGKRLRWATVLLAAGTPGKTLLLSPHSRVMIQPTVGGATGQTSDISIAAREIVRWKQTLNNVLAEHSGQSPERIGGGGGKGFGSRLLYDSGRGEGLRPRRYRHRSEKARSPPKGRLNAWQISQNDLFAASAGNPSRKCGR